MNAAPAFLRILADCIARSIITGLAVTTVLGLVTLLLVRPVLANAPLTARDDGNGDFPHPPQQAPGLLFKPANKHVAAPLLHTEVQLTVSGMIVRARVRPFPFDTLG